MAALLKELNQTPAVLRDLARYYQRNPHLLDLAGPAHTSPWVLTGMGASYHAAAIGALHLNHLGLDAVAIEAADLINYATALRGENRVLVYFSQSGSSGEIEHLLNLLAPQVRLVAVTNDPNSLLAQHAALTLPLFGGEELWIAGKTYVNSLALAWLLAKKAAGSVGDYLFSPLYYIADLLETALNNGHQLVSQLNGAFEHCSSLIFAGHGPHALTARAAAMVLSEWPKVSTLHFGIGAFRHGFIEAAGPGTGAVILTAPGPSYTSARDLALELTGYGVRVLCVEQGNLLEPSQSLPPDPAIDEFLNPLLDILPFQLYADYLAEAHNIPLGFRYISKIVRQI